MIRRIRDATLHVGHKANHEMRFIHHGSDRFRPWAAKKAHHCRIWRSTTAAARGFFLAGPIVRAWPWVIGKRKRRIFRVNAEWAGPAQNRMMAHAAQDLVGLCLIVINAFAISPAMRGK